MDLATVVVVEQGHSARGPRGGALPGTSGGWAHVPGPTAPRGRRSGRRWTKLLLTALVAGVLVSAEAGGRPCTPGIPAYMYPSSDSRAWQQAALLPAGSVLVVNPANGPGVALDPNYTAAVSALRTTEVVLYGYVDTAYGGRALDVMRAEARTWRDFYGVSGIFLDQTSSGGDQVPYYQGITDALHQDGFQVAMNPGQPDVDRRYLRMAEYVVTFEGPYAQYRDQRFPRRGRGAPTARTWHLVYDVPTEAAMRGALDLATRRGAELAFVTDGVMPNPWDRLPSYWSVQQLLLDRC